MCSATPSWRSSTSASLTDPDRLRGQILVNAARQFPEGDVQHWWHMPGGAGVRTHLSDDLLWLPYAISHHAEVTGDVSLLDEQVPFIDGPGIPEGRLEASAIEGRLGVQQSIIGRLHDLGGVATVRSAPGQGTEWELVVPRPDSRVDS